MTNTSPSICFESCPLTNDLSDLETYADCRGPNILALSLPKHGELAVRACVTRSNNGERALRESAELRTVQLQRIVNHLQRLVSPEEIDLENTGPLSYIFVNDQYRVDAANFGHTAPQGYTHNFWALVWRADEIKSSPEQNIVHRYELRVNADIGTYDTCYSKEDWNSTEGTFDPALHILDYGRFEPRHIKDLSAILDTIEPFHLVTE